MTVEGTGAESVHSSQDQIRHYFKTKFCVQPSLCLSHTEKPLGQQPSLVSEVEIQLRLPCSVIEALILARAVSKSSLLILLDQSAAFDSVNHQILNPIRKRASQESLSNGMSFISLIGPSRYLGEVRYPS